MVAVPTGVLALLSVRALIRAARGTTRCGEALALVAATAATVGVGTKLGRSVTSRVGASYATLDQIAEHGHLDLRCDERGGDEIGALNRSINLVLENFESVVRDVGEKSESMLDSVDALDGRHHEVRSAAEELAAGAAPGDAPYPALVLQALETAAFTLHGLVGAFRVGKAERGHARRFPRTHD